MSMLHYPDCLLSSFFNNNPVRICFISVLFNTLRELMQAFGFAGAGKQVTNTAPSTTTTAAYKCHNGQNPDKDSNNGTYNNGHKSGCPNDGKTSWQTLTKWNDTTNDNGQKMVNGSIAATNKLITLFVMMFCVFTGDGYLQHYRRCCRDNWPTTGYNKYQSFYHYNCIILTDTI